MSRSRSTPDVAGERALGPAGEPARLALVRFVLVEPQHPGNVGAAARALKNLGFAQLELVAPQCDPRGVEARRLAVGAADLLETARVHDTLDSALAGAEIVLGTSRRVGKHRRPHRRLDELVPELARGPAAQLAVVFGREAHGLRDDELDRCTHLVGFLASEDYPSFNLAQAVLLAAYELRISFAGANGEVPRAEPAADHATREAMYAHLETALRSIGFVSEQTADVMMRRLRRMLGRAALTADEASIVRGIARQVLWAAGRAGLVGDAGASAADADRDPRP